jgi:thiamine pyrophosphokinase
MPANYETGIILANGELNHPERIRERLRELDVHFVLAADGGVHHAPVLELHLDSVIGDLDSISNSEKQFFVDADVTIQEVSAHKDETDLELALLHAIDLSVKRIVILGGTGGRLDMTLSNMTLLTHPAIGSQRLEFWTNNQTTWLITPPGEGIEGAVGDTLSLIPLFEDALGVRTMNLAYPLQNEDLHQGPARGVSNVFTSGNVEVLLNSGSLVATHTMGRA